MRKFYIYVLLAALTCAVYWPARHFAFVNYDDEVYVYENQHVARGMTPANAAWAFRSLEVANYHPLTWVSWLIDSSLFGVRPGPFHVENVLLHVLSSLLLLKVLDAASGDFWPSAFVAAIFALHPVHVESVAWVSERKDVLSTSFLFLSIWMYLNFARTDARRAGWWYLAMLFFYACGLLSKPMIVTFPFILMLLDIWPLRRTATQGQGRFRPLSWRASILEKSPLLLMSILSCVVTYQAQHAGGALLGLEHVPLSARLENVFVSYARYVLKSVLPIHLSPYYPYHDDWSVWTILGSGLLIVAITAVCIRQMRRRPALLIGWLWFLGTLVPVIGIIQAGGQSIADRYLYVPLIGLAIMAAWLAVELSRAWRGAIFASAAVVLLAAGAVARHQLLFWRDTRTLFTHALQVINGNAVAHVQLGYLDAREGDVAGAMDHYNQAIQLAPSDYVAEFDMGNLLLKRNPQQAIEHYQMAARKNPGNGPVQNNWGKALVDLQRPGEAYEHFQAAVRLDPDYAEAHANLGRLLFESGFVEPARRECRIALQLDPDQAEAKQLLEVMAASTPSPAR